MDMTIVQSRSKDSLTMDERSSLGDISSESISKPRKDVHDGGYMTYEQNSAETVCIEQERTYKSSSRTQSSEIGRIASTTTNASESTLRDSSAQHTSQKPGEIPNTSELFTRSRTQLPPADQPRSRQPSPLPSVEARARWAMLASLAGVSREENKPLPNNSPSSALERRLIIEKAWSESSDAMIDHHEDTGHIRMPDHENFLSTESEEARYRSNQGSREGKNVRARFVNVLQASTEDHQRITQEDQEAEDRTMRILREADEALQDERSTAIYTGGETVRTMESSGDFETNDDALEPDEHQQHSRHSSEQPRELSASVSVDLFQRQPENEVHDNRASTKEKIKDLQRHKSLHEPGFSGYDATQKAVGDSRRKHEALTRSSLHHSDSSNEHHPVENLQEGSLKLVDGKLNLLESEFSGAIDQELERLGQDEESMANQHAHQVLLEGGNLVKAGVELAIGETNKVTDSNAVEKLVSDAKKFRNVLKDSEMAMERKVDDLDISKTVDDMKVSAGRVEDGVDFDVMAELQRDKQRAESVSKAGFNIAGEFIRNIESDLRGGILNVEMDLKGQLEHSASKQERVPKQTGKEPSAAQIQSRQPHQQTQQLTLRPNHSTDPSAAVSKPINRIHPQGVSGHKKPLTQPQTMHGPSQASLTPGNRQLPNEERQQITGGAISRPKPSIYPGGQRQNLTQQSQSQTHQGQHWGRHEAQPVQVRPERPSSPFGEPGAVKPRAPQYQNNVIGSQPRQAGHRVPGRSPSSTRSASPQQRQESNRQTPVGPGNVPLSTLRSTTPMAQHNSNSNSNSPRLPEPSNTTLPPKPFGRMECAALIQDGKAHSNRKEHDNMTPQSLHSLPHTPVQDLHLDREIQPSDGNVIERALGGNRASPSRDRIPLLAAATDVRAPQMGRMARNARQTTLRPQSVKRQAEQTIPLQDPSALTARNQQDSAMQQQKPHSSGLGARAEAHCPSKEAGRRGATEVETRDDSARYRREGGSESYGVDETSKDRTRTVSSQINGDPEIGQGNICQHGKEYANVDSKRYANAPDTVCQGFRGKTSGVEQIHSQVEDSTTVDMKQYLEAFKQQSQALVGAAKGESGFFDQMLQLLFKIAEDALPEIQRRLSQNQLNNTSGEPHSCDNE